MATNSGTKGNAKIWFIGAGVVVAAALVIFLGNYPPQPEDAAGTVGAAQRYSSTQITKDDVTVAPDALTTWLQSDTFDKIVKDPQAREIFTNPAFLQLSESEFGRRLLVLSTDATKGLQVAGDSEKLPTATTNAVKGIEVAADSEKLPMVTMAAVQAVTGDAALRNAVGNPKVLAFFTDARTLEILNNSNSRFALLQDARTQAAMKENIALARVLENEAVLNFVVAAATPKPELIYTPHPTGESRQRIVSEGKFAVVSQENRKLEGGVTDNSKFVLVSEAFKFLDTDAAKQLLVLSPAVVQQARENVAIRDALTNANFLTVVRDGVMMNKFMEEARNLREPVRD